MSAHKASETTTDFLPQHKAELASVTPPRILASWKRSQELYGLAPQERLRVRVLTRGEWRERQERLEHFLAVADSYVTSLHEKLACLNFCVMVTDNTGVTLDLRRNNNGSESFNYMNLVPGACWPEDEVGTGGIGTALYENAPILVHREEHFHPGMVPMSCSAAPIRDVDNNVLAILDSTGLDITSDRNSQLVIYGMVVQTASMIENAWFLAQSQNDWIIELSDAPRFFTSASDAIISFNESGVMLGGNRAARDSLLNGMHTRGSRFDQLFDVRLEDLFYTAGKHPGCMQEIHSYVDGARRKYYARVRGPNMWREKRSGFIAPTPTQVPHQERRIDDDNVSFDPQINTNIAMGRRLIDRHLPLLVLGETGSGKEVFARAVHAQSQRHDQAFVAINCAAIPETLIESELFGYRPGAFTGAKAKGERGKILQADGGTLFLDEIGDMPLALQTRLLRVLAEGEVVPLGAAEASQVDLNVICATHRDLATMVEQGLFREDLFYRINTATIHLPALRNRGDLLPLLRHIFAEEATKIDRHSLHLSPEVEAFAGTYRWPGNVRQLRNVMRFAVAICDGTEVTLAHLPPTITQQTPQAAAPTVSPSRPDAVARLDDKASDERNRMVEKLRHHKWHVSQAAKDMGVARATFYRRMTRYGIVSPNQAGTEADDPL